MEDSKNASGTHLPVEMLEAKIEAERCGRGIPAISAAIVHDEDLTWSKGFGEANVRARTPATSDTVYRIGSVTKVFTATMLMQLRDAGKLALDDPVEKYVPAFRVRSRFGDASAPTFRQLASHTAGLPREAPLGTWQRDGGYPPIEIVLESLKETEMVFPPFWQIKYSNLGYAILGHALAVAAGDSYEHYVAERILMPLGMSSSGFTLTDEMQSRVAVGYATGKGKRPELAPDPQFGALIPSGGLYSSVADLARFVSLQFNEDVAGSAQILKGSTLREMRAPVMLDDEWKTGFGIGWEVEHVADEPIVSISGATNGFYSDLFVAPKAKLGFAMCANAQLDSVMGLGRLVFETILLATKESPRQASRAAPIPADWEKYTGRYYIPGVMQVDVVIDNGHLAVSIPSGTPPNVILLPESGNGFRMQGGIVNGELAVFETNGDGQVVRLRAGSYVLERWEGDSNV